MRSAGKKRNTASAPEYLLVYQNDSDKVGKVKCNLMVIISCSPAPRARTVERYGALIGLNDGVLPQLQRSALIFTPRKVTPHTSIDLSGPGS